MTSRCFLLMAILLTGCLLPSGCSSSTAPAADGFHAVVLDGTEYTLELVADEGTRTVGLGGRSEIPQLGGMLFSFPKARMRQFVMRDCLIDIDIIFLDASGRIVAMHTMPVEEPREPDESMAQYEQRLKKYSSRYAAQFAIEIRGGMLETMSLETGDKIDLDLEFLKSVTQ